VAYLDSEAQRSADEHKKLAAQVRVTSAVSCAQAALCALAPFARLHPFVYLLCIMFGFRLGAVLRTHLQQALIAVTELGCPRLLFSPVPERPRARQALQ